MADADVLIVGAGAAGAIAALTATKRGLRTVVLERENKVGGHTKTKIDVTEGTGILPIIRSLELKTLGYSNTSHWSAPNTSLTLHSKTSDVFFKRGPDSDSLETHAVQAAKKRGAKLITGVKKLEYLLDAKGYCSRVEAWSGQKRYEIRPQTIIIAEGDHTSSLDPLGFSWRKQEPLRIIGYGFSSRRMKLASGSTNLFLDAELLPKGYFYAIKNKGFGFASIVLDARQTAKKELSEYYWDFVHANPTVRELVKTATDAAYVDGGCTAYSLDSLTKNNILAVGTAGRLFDPLFGYGVRQAIYSGYWAATALADAKGSKQKDWIEPGIKQYEIEMQRQLLPEIRAAWKARPLFESLTNKDLNTIIRELNSAGEGADELIERPSAHLFKIMKILLRHPRLAWLALKAIS